MGGEVEVVLHGQGLLPNDRLHGHDVLPHGVRGIELVGHGAVVTTRHALANGGLHQAREGREDVDGGEDTLGVKLAVEVDLPLSDVPGKVGNGVRNVVIGHGKDGKLGDRPVPPYHATSTFINCGEIRVHVPGITPASWHLLPRRGHLSQRVGVRRHVREDNEHVQVPLVREILSRRQGETGRDDPLNGRVVGQVEEQGSALHSAALLEVAAEKPGGFHVHSHGAEDDGEVLLVRVLSVLETDERRLASDLSGHLVVGQTCRREDGDLLPTRHGVHHVDGRDTRLDHRLGVVPAGRVDGLAVDVEVGLRQDGRAVVDDLSGSVERPPKHLLRHAHLEHVSSELAPRLEVVDVRGALEDLDDGPGAGHLEDLAGALGAVRQGEVDDFGVLWQFHVVQQDQRVVHSGDRPVLEAGNDRIVLHNGQLVHFSPDRDEPFISNTHLLLLLLSVVIIANELLWY